MIRTPTNMIAVLLRYYTEAELGKFWARAFALRPNALINKEINYPARRLDIAGVASSTLVTPTIENPINPMGCAVFVCQFFKGLLGANELTGIWGSPAPRRRSVFHKVEAVACIHPLRDPRHIVSQRL